MMIKFLVLLLKETIAFPFSFPFLLSSYD